MDVAANTDPVAAKKLARGYIRPHALSELWFHTGTACNLACPFCLEGSKPGDNRLQRITLEDIKPFIEEAMELGVEQFSFTGGEPFVVKDFVNVLSFASNFLPCLVLTNGTDALLKRLHQLEPLLGNRFPISFRVSIDWPDRARHDKGRGDGSFDQSVESIVRLQKLGFGVSLARQIDAGENTALIDAAFQELLRRAGYAGEIRIVAFPDFALPGQAIDTPFISEDCMTRYQNEESRRQFMCAFSKMVIKKNGQMRVYACTLVDDDDRYDLGESLQDSVSKQITLAHHRCYSCFAYGSSCSER